MESIRLMVIGRERGFAASLSDDAEPNGQEIDVVTLPAPGAEALARAAAWQPDVILLETRRGDRGSIETSDIIARLAVACRARILMLAEASDPDSTVRLVKAGARGVVLSGEQPATIRKAVRKVRQGELWLDRRTTGHVLEVLAVERAQAARSDVSPNGGADKLTTREMEVVRALLAHDGAGSRDLAAGLRVSEHTLRNHFTSIYRKLGVPNRTGLFAYASKHRLGGTG